MNTGSTNWARAAARHVVASAMGLGCCWGAQAQIVLIKNSGYVSAGTYATNPDVTAPTFSLSVDTGDTSSGRAYAWMSSAIANTSIDFAAAAGGSPSASGPYASRYGFAQSSASWTLVFQVTQAITVVDPNVAMSFKFGALSSPSAPESTWNLQYQYSSSALASLDVGTYAMQWTGGGSAAGIGSATNIKLNFLPVAVPEPETWALMSLGMLGLAASARHRKVG
jgi:hypothetical protein